MNNNVNNLHSLLAGKWMITNEFASSLTPYLISILTKGDFSFSNTLESGTPYCFVNTEGNVSSEDSGIEDKQIAILNIKGPILQYSQNCGPMGTKDMMVKMEEWKPQENIVGVFLDFDTGGGQLAGTPKFAEYIYYYNQVKPVLGFTEGNLASAGLYLASGCKEIIADKHAMAIGSLGTMHKSINMDGAIEKLGGKVIEVYADKSTKKNYASREARNGNLTPLIKDELNPLNEKFHEEVLTYRPSIKEEALDGHHTFNIQKALTLGLIDAIGDKQFAINRLFQLAEENNNTKNQNKNMSGENKNFYQIAAAIGQEDIQLSSKILTGKKGVFLTQLQLDLLEQKLEGHDAALNDLNATIESNSTIVADLQSNALSVTDAVSAALEIADLEAAESTEASITLLGEKVKEYGAQPGAIGATIKPDLDRNPGEGESTAIMDSI